MKVSPQIGGWHTSSRWRSFTVMSMEEERQLDEVIEDMPDLEAGVLLLSVGLYGEAIYRFDAATASETDLKSALRWRGNALAEIGLYEEAYRDLTKAAEQR